MRLLRREHAAFPSRSRLLGPAICAGLALVVAASVTAATQAVFARELAPLFANAQGDASIGSVTPGTPLVVAAAGNGRESVTLDGWSQVGGETIVDAEMGQRIVLATLTAPGIAQRRVIDTARDAYGNTWNHVQIAAYVDPANTTPDVTTVWSAAQQLYATRCSACHALHATTDFTANQWPGILQTMEKNAALDPQQAALITQYLQTHARAP